MIEIAKKVKAVMLGHAVGDALGVPVEFCTRAELDKKPVTEMMGYGTYSVPEGSWSDDTSMSLCALESLAKGSVNYNEVMQNFVLWERHNEFTPTGKLFDIGGACIKAIRSYITSDRSNPFVGGLLGETSNGNGSLMRIHPFSLFLYYNGWADETHMEVIHRASALTHAHERSKVACGIYTFVLWALLENPDKSSIIKGLERAREFYMYSPEFKVYDRMLIKKIGRISGQSDTYADCKEVSREEIKSTGYVVDTLEAAIWCLLTTEDYRSCVLTAVNLGEDTDTVAAIAGGLAGALYGYDGIPREWLDTLKRRDFIENMCESAAAAWIK